MDSAPTGVDAPAATRAVLYVDGGVRVGSGGAGYVARCGARMALGHAPIPAVSGVAESEFEAALVGLARTIETFPGLRQLEIRSDNADVGNRAAVTAVSTAYGERMRSMASAAGVNLVRTWIPGHTGCGTATGFLNSIAHTLSAMGLEGGTGRWEVPHDAFWRLRIMDCAPRLVRPEIGPTRREAAHVLGVGPEVVRRLVATGHLKEIKGSDLLDPYRFVAVWRAASVQGTPWETPVPPMPGDLPPRRGLADDPASGVRLAPPPASPVRVDLRCGPALSVCAAGWVVSSPDGARAVSRRLPLGVRPPWVTALRAAIEDALDPHPGCDELVVSLDDPNVVPILNRSSPSSPSMDDFLTWLDETLDARRIEFRAEPACRNDFGVASDYEGILARAMFAAAVSDRAAGPFHGEGARAIARDLRLGVLSPDLARAFGR
jgi:hypothetical protein